MHIEKLIETIKQIYIDKTTGELSISFGDKNRYIYFINGNIRYARSEFENERVGQFFIKDGLIDEVTLEKALVEAKNNNQILGEYLKGQGIASSDKLKESVKKLIIHIATRAFVENISNLNFQKQQQFIDDAILLKLSTVSVLLEGTRMLKDTFIFENFLSEFKEKIPVLIDNPDTLFQELSLTPHEGYILSRIDKSSTISQIAAVTGLLELEVSKLMFALNAVGMVYFKSQNESTARQDKEQQSEKPITRDEAFVEEVEKFYAMLDKMNYYDILEVSRNSSEEDIKKGYVKQIKKFHPDRHSAKLYFDITAKLEAITNKVTEANNTLSNKSKRSLYDGELRKKDEEKMRSRDVDQKEQIYQNAMTLLREGRSYHAITMLQRGIQVAPNDKRFNLELGKLLSYREETTDKAKYHLKKVLKIDAGCTECYLFLARIAKKQGDINEAKKYFSDLATFDPGNKEAEEFLNGGGNKKNDIFSSFKNLFGKKKK
jgi:curved DNA-binding protein CbpA